MAIPPYTRAGAARLHARLCQSGAGCRRDACSCNRHLFVGHVVLPDCSLADPRTNSIAKSWAESGSLIGRAEPEPSGLEPGLDAILSKALRKNPSERYFDGSRNGCRSRVSYLEGLSGLRTAASKVFNLAAALASIVLGSGGVAFWQFHRSNAASRRPTGPVSIAVLPFTDANRDNGPTSISSTA